MSNSLSFDVACFKQELPVHFKGFEAWKDFEACRMLTEMEIEHIDTYQLVKPLFKMFTQYKAHSGGSHSGAKSQIKRQPLYANVTNFATIMERIASLEHRVAFLEGAKRD